jgi:ATP-dependent helicase HepA
VALLYEALGIFREPLGGLDRSLGHVEEAIRKAAVLPSPSLDIPAVIRETREARALMNRALYHDLHRNRYLPERAAGILSRIPPDLQERTARVVLGACRQLGFETVAKPEPLTYYIEFGPEATIEHLPGVPEGSRWLGTFDRELAVARETLDFFASGHPLVEGILMELEDGHRGQTALLDVVAPGRTGGGLVAVLGKGAEFEVRVMDFEGRPKPEWAPFFAEGSHLAQSARPADWGLTAAEARARFARRVRKILAPLSAEAKLLMAAVFRFVSGVETG